MYSRYIGVVLLGAALVEAGCGKPEPAAAPKPAPKPSASPVATPPPPEILARIHWAGAKQIGADVNGAVLKGVWAMPESAKLENQTLDKLSLAAWSLLRQTVDTNAGALLRPLLADVLRQESRLEIRQATNQPAQLAFAIRLDDARAALWETNLAAVLESLTGVRPVAATGGQRRWTLKRNNPPNLLELARVGAWTVFGAAQDRNPLLDDARDWLERQPASSEGRTTNSWLEADLDIPRLASAFAPGWNLPADFPRISLTAAGQDTNVWTYGDLKFSRPLPLELEPWNVPTNFIDASLGSFMCVRGFKPWLASLKAWNHLQIGPPPNQLYVWAFNYQMVHTYFAAPLPDASNAVRQLTDFVLERNDRFFGTNDVAGFRRSERTNGLDWKGIPYLYPYLQSIETSNGGFVFGGMFPAPEPEPLPASMLPKALSLTNLLYHDWELTGTRIEQWVYTGQFIRYACHIPQMAGDSVSMAWIRALEPAMRSSVTDVTRTAPDQLSFERRSTIGFTAIELNLLADWLDSPRFPVGLHSSLAPPPPPLVSP
jgi:hypothetical protein